MSAARSLPTPLGKFSYCVSFHCSVLTHAWFNCLYAPCSNKVQRRTIKTNEPQTTGAIRIWNTLVFHRFMEQPSFTVCYMETGLCNISLSASGKLVRNQFAPQHGHHQIIRYCYCYCCDGVRLYETAASLCLWSSDGIILTGMNTINRRRACPSSTMSIRDPAWTRLGSNPGYRCH
jgi:hypothetical protein